MFTVAAEEIEVVTLLMECVAGLDGFGSEGVGEGEDSEGFSIAGELGVAGLLGWSDAAPTGSTERPVVLVVVDVAESESGGFGDGDGDFDGGGLDGADVVEEAAADGVEVAGGEMVEGVALFDGELAEGFGIGEGGVFEGEGAGFVEDDFFDSGESGPEVGGADEDAETLHPGGGEVVGIGGGHAEGTGAGDDEDGDHDLEGKCDVVSVDPPPRGSADSDEDDDDEVGTHEGGVEERGVFCGFAALQKALQKGLGPSFAGGDVETLGADVEGA